MKRTIWILAGAALATITGAAIADDHLRTATEKGGLTTDSQPFLNGTNNSGRAGTTVPGQGSPLSGEDTTTPAVGTDQLFTKHGTELNTHANPGNGTLRTPPAVDKSMSIDTTTTSKSGKTAPSTGKR